MKSLSLLVLVLVASVIPSDAHATCDYHTLEGDANAFFHAYIGWSVLETFVAYIPGTSCGSGNSLEFSYHNSGQPDFWELFTGTSCGTAGAIKQLNSQVYWKPTTWQFFGQFACTCSTANGQRECHWF